ncbi:hypothetical protein [Azospirillum griseum]|uniref:hypothetical protein n=1 Tax=Azospirillum griseum TaxID=2496639 RepID=UPI001AED0224|nr:hypothetical protein [Azospirillum griseum]
MTDPREKLLQQIRDIREKMDPKLVERAKLAVFGKVPYDRDNAQQAVGHFLDARNDGGAFRRKLAQALKAEGAGLDLDPPPSAPSEGKPGGGKAAADKADGKSSAMSSIVSFIKPRRGGRMT